MAFFLDVAVILITSLQVDMAEGRKAGCKFLTLRIPKGHKGAMVATVDSVQSARSAGLLHDEHFSTVSCPFVVAVPFTSVPRGGLNE